VDLIEVRAEGLYCGPGDFYIDPWRAVERAVITHAHADHARPGSAHYLAAGPSAQVLRVRLPGADIETVRYAERVVHDAVTISLHPAGHVLGSAQVRVEYRGEVWVVSGDYKCQPDPTCAPFEPVRAHAFVTESTFGLPIYRWPDPASVTADIAQWWRGNAATGRTSVLFCYAFGKAQRIAAMLAAQRSLDTGPLACHGAMIALNDAYRASGVALPAIVHASALDPAALPRALVLAPPSAGGTPWLRRFGDFASGFASGWMQVRRARRRHGVERGFVLSDHADWPGLHSAIEASGATRIRVTHGDAPIVVRWLREQGRDAAALATQFADEGEPTALSGDEAGEGDFVDPPLPGAR
jgi:putative mRNA 3-end processing factor